MYLIFCTKSIFWPEIGGRENFMENGINSSPGEHDLMISAS